MNDVSGAMLQRHHWLLPLVLAAILLELAWYWRHDREAYDLKETGATLLVMIGQIVLRAASAVVILPVFLWAERHRLFALPADSILGLVALFLAVDVTYYWFHRASHEVRWLWATHAVHHSSTHINFPAAYRLGWTNLISGGWLFLTVPILIGFPAEAVAAMFAADLAFQFFLHTERVGSLGPLEWLFNTPRHHLVHHASNPDCLDRNYGGVLIVFDRLFGTFAEAPLREPLRFGLVGRAPSYNPVTIVFGEWIAMIKDVRRHRDFRHKVATLFAMPGSRRSTAIAVLLLGAAALVAPQVVHAQDTGREAMRSLIRACFRDARHYCRGVPRGGGQVLACLEAHGSQLSGACRSELGQLNNGLLARESARVDTAALPHGTRILKDFAYGPDAKQRLDVYAPAHARDAAIIVMLHGGAWAFGDKDMKSVVQNKAAHWLESGLIFVSVDTRLLPAATPLEQARDMARALAAVQAHAREWGGDPRRIVLMGHSAGAQIVALLAADPALAAKEGARPWAGTVALDSAALNVPQIMNARHFPLYDRAFGSSRADWIAASPYQQLKKAPAPMLLVCSTKRSDSCSQADAFAAKVNALGGHARVLRKDLNHLQINAELGTPGAYTGAIDAFLRSVVGTRP